jgi:hypothetical protein
MLFAPAHAQQQRLKLDALGLPPFPGGSSVGQISLPLTAILQPKPGETATGPKLTDLSITSYRTPLSVPVAQIAGFYRKYATEAGWRLLDDIPESAAKRSLVFWSPAAPGYLTVDITFSPDSTLRQIDLTRLLGDVDPQRPGEILKLTGKRVRQQQVTATFAGRFLDIKSNKFARTILAATEETAESGLAVADAQWIAPVAETYEVSLRITDVTKKMTRAQVYAGNGDKIAEVVSATPAGTLHATAVLRASQGLALRVLILGLPPVAADTGEAAPTAGAAEAKEPPAVVEFDNHDPDREIIFSEWAGVRPPRTALVEARRGSVDTRVNPRKGEEEDMGPSCDEALSRTIPWTARTTDGFTFSPDFFGPGFPRAQVGTREGTVKVEFARGTGLSNFYTLTRNETTTETQVQVGYSFSGQWLALPSKKRNPQPTTYMTSTTGPPTVTRRSTGTCPPSEG